MIPKILQYTLVTDGPSDRGLMRIIDWVLQGLTQSFAGEFADFRQLADPPRSPEERLRRAVTMFPCDVLFVHRDAETEFHSCRVTEIQGVAARADVGRYVAIVPVRMTEAWLLIDEHAIRQAAGNPNGRAALQLPPFRTLESVPNPKDVLQNLLVVASNFHGRRRHKFQRELSRRMQRVGELIVDFEPLRELSAFGAFEAETHQAVARWTATASAG